MARRDLFITSDEVRGRIPVVYDLMASDIQQLYKLSKEDPFNALTVCFRFGYVLGHRATLRGKYKEQVRRNQNSLA